MVISVKRTTDGAPPETVYGQHVGETIVVIGNSSSLNGMDLELLDSFTTIGLNRILRIYDPIYLMIVDNSVMRDEAQRLAEFSGILLAYPGVMSSKNRRIFSGPWVSTGKMTGQCDPCAKKGPIHICRSGGNSAYEAAQIAYRMGAKRIALAGIDMYWPPGQDSHFFGSGSKAGCKLHKPEDKIADFGRLKDQYAQGGVEMFSISPWDTPFRKRMGYIDVVNL
jgi:hypothetical protein